MPSHSPYSSNGRKMGPSRFNVDFRKLNNKTVTDTYAIPRVEESFHLLGGAGSFSKLDFRIGSWEVEIKVEDTQKTAVQVDGLGFY